MSLFVILLRGYKKGQLYSLKGLAQLHRLHIPEETFPVKGP